MQSEARWAMSIRVLAVLAALLLILTILEGWTVRRARAELQELRTEREQIKAGLASHWAEQPAGEFGQALRWLNEYSADKADGLGWPGGLCAGGRLNDGAIVTFAVGAFVPARAAGLSVEGSIGAMRNAVLKSEAYRIVHPTRAMGK